MAARSGHVRGDPVGLSAGGLMVPEPTFTDINRLVETRKAHSDELKRCIDKSLAPFIRAPSGTWLAKAASAVGQPIKRFKRSDGGHYITFDYKGIKFGCITAEPDRKAG